jgi:hypothetical protein
LQKNKNLTQTHQDRSQTVGPHQPTVTIFERQVRRRERGEMRLMGREETSEREREAGGTDAVWLSDLEMGHLSLVPCGRSRWCLWVIAGGWLTVGSGGRCRWGPAGGVR